MSAFPIRPPLTRRRLWMALSGLGGFMAIASVAALFMGAEGLDWSAAWSNPDSVDSAILWDHRLPRVLQGLLVGGVLAASGAALQGLLRNPLAEPFILGVSGGAAFGSALVALTGLTAIIAEPVGGFIGALSALFLVTAIASHRGKSSPLAMLLVGVVLNGVFGAALMGLQAVSEAAAVQRVLLRLMGTLAPDPSRPLLLPALAATAIIGLGLTFTRARALDLLGLGDDTARSLGVRPNRLRLTLFLALSLPIGAVVAVSGLIGFVGLIVPHGVRLLWGPDHRLLIPASALGGAALLVLADGLVRILAGPLGTELPVGALTTALGGPIFLILLRRSRALSGSLSGGSG